MPGAARYQLQIASDPQFASVVLAQEATGAFFRWNQLPTRRYYWRVRSVDAEGRFGGWSGTERIEPAVQPPTLLSPPPNGTARLTAEGRGPVLRAEPSRTLKEYVFQVAAGPELEPLVFEKRQASPSVELKELPPGSYHWRVRGIDLQGGESEFSEARPLKVVLDPPALSSEPRLELQWATPPPSVELKWRAHPLATAFTVEVTGPDGAPALTRVQRSGWPFTAPAPGLYRWRVWAETGTGERSEPSASAEVSVASAAPVLAAPAEGQVVQTRREAVEVAFSWSARSGAADYQLELSPEGGEPRTVETALPSASVPLSPGRYRWRVTARFGAGAPMASEPRALEVTLKPPLPTPALAQPEEGGVVPRRSEAERLVVEWPEVPEAVEYELELDGAATKTPQPRFEAAAAEGEHTVRLRAFDAEGAASEWSAPRRLRFVRPPPARAQVEVAGSRREVGEVISELTVRLFDAEGVAVPDLPLELGASVGQVELLASDERGYRVRHRAPLVRSTTVELTVAHGEFRATERFAIRPPEARLGFAARVGLRNNFGAVSAAQLQLEALYRTPLLGARLLAALRIGVYGAGAPMPEPVQPLFRPARATVVPIAALALYEHPLGPVSIYGGGGLVLSVTQVEVGDAGETSVIPGVLFAGGAAYPLWRGKVLAELSVGSGGFDSPLARLTVGGAALTLGYRFEL